MSYAKIETEEIDFTGGLDLVSPALSIAPGALIDSLNYEPDIDGGYRRMYGFERIDGHASPSAQTYWLMELAITGSIAVGNTVTGGTSGATGVVLQVNGTSELVLTAVTGTFVPEFVSVSAVTVGLVTAVNQTAANTPSLDAQYTYLASQYYRNLIGAVPGSGSVLGANYYNGVLYAFRNNAGGTAALMYKATSTGWQLINFGQEIQFSQRTGNVTITIATPGVVTFNNHGAAAGNPVSFGTTGALPTGLVAGTVYYVLAPTTNTFQVAATPGGAAIATTGSQSGTQSVIFQGNQTISVGMTVTGATSGASAVVTAALLQTGTWTISPKGSFVFDSVTGVFQSGEALLSGGLLIGGATTANTAISLKPGGRFEFQNYNFSGTYATYKMYFVDGVNFLSEFDGTRLVPIRTGITSDNPKFLACWQLMMVVSIDSQVESSGIGLPYSWTALTGASVLALGEPCTGLLPQVSSQTGGSMAIFTGTKTYMLYGTSSSNFQLVIQSPDAGAVPYTVQNIGFAYYLNTKGVVQINATREFGNFAMSTLTRKIQPIIDSKRGMAVASCVIRATNQVRHFFSDGTGIILYMQPQNTESIGGSVLLGDEVGGVMYFDYTNGSGNLAFNGITSCVDINGIERTFACGSNGYVYELERGTSFDGGTIQSHLLTSFNSSKSSRNRKHYVRTILAATCKNIAEVNVGFELSYGSSEVTSGFQSNRTLTGGGNWWDVMTFDNFLWDSPYVTEYVIDTPGNGRNMSIIIWGNSAIDLPYTFHGATTNYTLGRLERG